MQNSPLSLTTKGSRGTLGAFQIFAGWRPHQPRLMPVVDVPTHQNRNEVRKFEIHPFENGFYPTASTAS
jgi:hypothetical protein